ncbi:PREDICTED: myophilin-like, partial [Acropora digitifera]|uniref:myophilin-like n=1 Tax=Acropora digitifera TaxID=70779 RepID=UPI00077A7AC0
DCFLSASLFYFLSEFSKEVTIEQSQPCHLLFIVCRLANKIQPGSIKKINKMKTPFMMMENIGWFSDFVRAFGVQPEYGFVTVDLFEKQNVIQVLIALKWLKIEAEKKGIKL